MRAELYSMPVSETLGSNDGAGHQVPNSLFNGFSNAFDE